MKISYIYPLDEKARSLLELAVGQPSPEKMKAVVESYNTLDHFILGYYEGRNLLGLIGLQIKVNEGIIKHIAVQETHRAQGIGRMLIDKAIKQFQLRSLEAETDKEAVEFYFKCNFTITPFKGDYGKRFKCKLTLPHTNDKKISH